MPFGCLVCVQADCLPHTRSATLCKQKNQTARPSEAVQGGIPMLTTERLQRQNESTQEQH
eukprot:scaffold11515_cov13-Tisochrysis_lutea.AAC.1